MTFKDRFDKLAREKAKALGRRLTYEEVLGVGEEAHKASIKERKKAGIHPDAARIYSLYPKKSGGEAALVAITKALQKNTVEYLLDKTSQFARAVADWSQSYRYFPDGGDRCWNPVNFYNDGHYADDPATWKRAGSRSSPPPVKRDLPEPINWREVHGGSRYAVEKIPWHAIDAATQQWIIDNTPSRNTA